MTVREALLIYTIILVQSVVIIRLARNDIDTVSTIQTGHKQIISALELNSCFHLEIPPDTLDETGKAFK